MGPVVGMKVSFGETTVGCEVLPLTVGAIVTMLGSEEGDRVSFGSKTIVGDEVVALKSRETVGSKVPITDGGAVSIEGVAVIFGPNTVGETVVSLALVGEAVIFPNNVGAGLWLSLVVGCTVTSLDEPVAVGAPVPGTVGATVPSILVGAGVATVSVGPTVGTSSIMEVGSNVGGSVSPGTCVKNGSSVTLPLPIILFKVPSR